MAGVSHTQVAEYKRKVLLPAIQAAAKINALKTVAESPQSQAESVSNLTRAALAADPFLARMESRQQARDEVMLEARAAGDLKAWCTADRNDIAATQLHAELAGRLHQPAAAQVSIYVLAPATVSMDAPGGPIVDIEPSE